MSKICRMVSTFLIVVGLCFLYFYIHTQNANDKFTVLNKPSYFVLQNYWYIFLAGTAVLVFSLCGSFFSWFKEMEEKEEILPNAGYSSKKDITDWVGGSSLDTEHFVEENTENSNKEQDSFIRDRMAGKTELLMETDKTVKLSGDDKTEVLSEDSKTELLSGDDRTEMLSEDDRTVILLGSDKTEVVMEGEKTELLSEETQGDTK